MWKQKFNTYSVIMASVFLGMSWNFLSSSKNFFNNFIASIFLDIFSPLQVGILLIIWISSGTIFGVAVAYAVDKISAKQGSSWWNDFAFKSVISLTIIGYAVIGVIYSFNVTSYWLYIILMVFLGIGNLGSFGIIFLSFV